MGFKHSNSILILKIDAPAKIIVCSRVKNGIYVSIKQNIISNILSISSHDMLTADLFLSGYSA
jgi:hypothetical protein